MDPTTGTAYPVTPGQPEEQRKPDPLVKVWRDRITAAEKHWEKLHARMRHNRKLVRGIDDSAEADKPAYNKHRANLIMSTLAVVLSKVYAKNPEMSATPRNKARDLRLFADTVAGVTQAMLEDGKLKAKAKATVRAAMTCSYGVVKVQYQRVTQGESDPIIRQRIADTQDNIERLQRLAKELEDPQAGASLEVKQRELEETLAGLRSQSEVIAAEGLVLDRVRSDRLLVDPAVEDIWEYESAGYMVEKIPMRKSKAAGMFPGADLKHATAYKIGEAKSTQQRGGIYSGGTSTPEDDPIIMVYEVWSHDDQRIYTLVDGCTDYFARDPYTPKFTGERWWAHFILPFQSVDGEFAAQSLVDVVERLQQEHNETRDKFAELRRNIRPHFIVSGDLKDKDIQKMSHPVLGEYVVINTNGAPLSQFVLPAPQLQLDPNVFDTSPIRNDWEMVTGLQDAARSIVVQPKTATEAAISNQSLSARVEEFRDQVEDWLTEIAQYSSELCLLALTPEQVETIMGKPTPPDPHEVQEAAMQGMQPPQPTPSYFWPDDRRPETVFNLIQMKIRAGSTAAPNKLEQQENWNKALQLLMPMIDKIRAVEAAGGDATPERELVKDTASKFDESIDIDRYLPPKPMPRPAMPAGPGMPGGMPGGMPAAPIPPLASADPAALMPHMQPGAPLQ